MKPPERLSWTVHPFMERPLVSLAVLAAMAVSWAFGHYLLGPAGLLVAVLGTVSPLAHYLFPNEYTLTDEGVSVRVVLPSGVKPWDRFIGYTVYPDGVLLAYDPSVLRNRIHKGVFLRFAGNREAVLAFVRRRLGEGDGAPQA
ncbi:MAG: hypothetical protein IMW98_04980 [Firmicutes bacterium]|nr:hypothetical protein [Bacillota bacterium]